MHENNVVNDNYFVAGTNPTNPAMVSAALCRAKLADFFASCAAG